MLPDEAQRIFVLAHAALSETLSDDEYFLGGGTALAARWQHRDSTDIDLFMSPETYFRLVDEPQRFQDRFESLAGGSGAMTNLLSGHVADDRAHSRFGLTEGIIDIVGRRPILPGGSLSLDVVKGTGVRLESTAEILARKVAWRLSRDDLLARDLYDIVVARRLDPSALDSVWVSLPATVTNRVERSLENALRTGGQLAGPPLLRPVFAHEEAELVQMVPGELHRYREGGFSARD